MAKMDDEQFKVFLEKIGSFEPDKLIKLMVQARAAKAVLTQTFDAEESQYKQIMETCEQWLLDKADKQGVTGFTTEFGTTYISESMKVSIADNPGFDAFVRDSGDLEFFERRVSSRHVEEYMKANGGNLPPGLNVFRQRNMRVRAKKGE